jgi:hypothetical protein
MNRLDRHGWPEPVFTAVIVRWDVCDGWGSARPDLRHLRLVPMHGARPSTAAHLKWFTLWIVFRV